MRSRSARSRSRTSATPRGWPSSSTPGVLEADRVVAVIGKTEGNGGVNDYTRIIADRAFREVLMAEGHPRPRRGHAGADRLVGRHRRRPLAARHRVRDPPARPPRRAGRPRRAAAHRRLRDERAAAAGGHRPATDDREGRRRREGGDGAGRHHRRGRRPLRADEDPAADHPHHPRRQEPRQDRVDRAHPRVDGPLERHHRPRRRGGPGRDRDAVGRRRHARPLAVQLGRVVLVGRRARPGAGRGRGQRRRRRRPLPDRALGDEGRAGRRRHLGGHP